MKNNNGNIHIWDIEGIARFSVYQPCVDSYVAARRRCMREKWNELSKYYNSSYESTEVKSLDKFMNLCMQKNYKYTRRKSPSQIYVNINGMKFYLDFGLNSMEVKMKPSVRNVDMISKFKTEPEILIQQMEEYSMLVEKLPNVLDSAIHLGKILETTTKIAYPYILNRIESSGCLDGLKHEVIKGGCCIYLRMKDPNGEDGEYYEGEVSMDNLDIILHTIPIALSDPENFEYYFPSFALCWEEDSKFK